MKKIYNSAELSVVVVRNNNIILTSGFGVSGGRSIDAETLNEDNVEDYTISW